MLWSSLGFLLDLWEIQKQSRLLYELLRQRPGKMIVTIALISLQKCMCVRGMRSCVKDA